jgi:hypothetical protein
MLGTESNLPLDPYDAALYWAAAALRVCISMRDTVQAERVDNARLANVVA